MIGFCPDPKLIKRLKTFHIQTISILYDFAFPASFSRRTKRPAGASIPRRICFPRTSTTMTVILSPMRIFSSSFKVKINIVALLRRGRYLLLGLSFLSAFCLSFLGFWASLLSLSFLPLSPTALSFDSSTFQSWLRAMPLT